MADQPELATEVVAPLQHRSREIDLDVVRGCAILLAMGWHLNSARTGFAPLEWLLIPGRQFGWAGVDIFFVLSGFLVGRMIFTEFENSGGFDYPRFLIRRIFRLWPVLYTFLFAMLFLSGTSPWTFFWQIALHVQNYADPAVATHLWSLAVEEHFYLLFAIGFAGLLLLRGDARHLAWPMVGIMALALMARCVGVWLGASPQAIQWQTQYRIDALAAGVFLANLSVFRAPLFDRIVRLKPIWIMVVLAGYFFLALTSKNSVVGMTIGYTISYVAAAAFMLLIYRSGIDRVLYWPCLGIAIIGQLAYTIYIFHVPVAKVMPKLLQHISILDHHPAPLILADYVAAIGLSWLVTKAVERPFMNLRDRLFPSAGKAVQ